MASIFGIYKKNASVYRPTTTWVLFFLRKLLLKQPENIVLELKTETYWRTKITPRALAKLENRRKIKRGCSDVMLIVISGKHSPDTPGCISASGFLFKFINTKRATKKPIELHLGFCKFQKMYKYFFKISESPRCKSSGKKWYDL